MCGAILPSGPPQTGRVRVGLAYEAWEPSSRDPSVRHHVTCDAEGNWDCTCEAVDYRARADGQCRHIDKHRRIAAEPLMVLVGRL